MGSPDETTAEGIPAGQPGGRVCPQPGCACGGSTRHATPTPPAPADARPMVVGGAFVKFDRPAPAPDAGWEPWGNPYPRHPDVIRTRDLCLAICEKHQAFDAAAEIRVMHLPPAPDAGAAEDHPSEAKRDHGAEGSDRAVVEAALRWFANSRTERDCVDEYHTTFREADEQDLYDAAERLAALRGTNQAKRGNDARKGGEGA